MALLSIIIVSYRTPDLLRRGLEALTHGAENPEQEIIVVDNDSGDESPEVARSFPGVRVLETGRNLGFAGGVNRGLEQASGRFLLILNPDVEVHPGAVVGLLNYMKDHPQTGIAAPKLLNTDGSLQYSCRRSYTLKTILLRRTFLGRFFPEARSLRRHLMMDYDHAVPRAVDWVSGAAMLARAEAVEDVGPMDDRYFLYFEDVDWCARMQARGWVVHYVPDFVMTHHWQRASRHLGTAARRHIHSGLRFYDRWSGLLYVLRRYEGVWRRGALVLWDLAAVITAFGAAHALRRELAFALQKPHWSLSSYGGFFTASVLVYMGAFAMLGMYRGLKEGDWVDVVFRIGKAATLGTFALMASTFVLDMQGYSRFIVLASWPLLVALTLVGRLVLNAVFTRAQRDRWALRRIALVGEDEILDRLEQTMIQHPEQGWEPVRIRRTPWVGLPPAEGEALLIHQLAGERVSEVVVTPGSLGVTEKDLAGEVLPLRRAGFGVRLVSSFFADLPARARLESTGDVSWVSLERPPLSPTRFVKRLVDMAGSLLLIVPGALPCLAILLFRAITGKKMWEPIQTWVGRWGEAHDVRRLGGGGWLRAYPLLGEVLRGRFSLVGPRPLSPGEEVPGGEAWSKVRKRYRPGLVGPWTLTPVQTAMEEMQQELRYLEDWSPERDFKLLTRVALNRSGGGTGRGSASPATRDCAHQDAKTATSSKRVHSMGK